MSLSKIKTEVAVRSDTGRVRHGNEDALAFDTDAGLFVVCDGMGGAAAGDIASKMAVNAFLDHARQGRLGPAEIQQVMDEAAQTANTVVHEYACEHPRLHGMGTTLVAMHVPRERMRERLLVTLAHVGDSRCYRLHEGVLEQMTMDHSLVSEQARMGQITWAEAAVSPMRNVITRAIGSHPDVDVEVTSALAESGDVFLLCSDGLTRDLDDDDLRVIMDVRSQTLETTAQKLVDMANDAGGGDNITVLLVRVSF